MIRRIVSFPRRRWSRADAWFLLREQQFPGAPEVLATIQGKGLWLTPWRKSHTANAWRWYHDICDHGAASCRACPRCQNDELQSANWLGLRPGLEEPRQNTTAMFDGSEVMGRPVRGLGPFDGGSEW